MERRRIEIRGIVQGVGFRPFAHHLAHRYRLTGFVHNQNTCVVIEVEGEAHDLDGFLRELTDQPPPLAQIDELSWEVRPPLGESDFHIATSVPDSSGVVCVAPDVATCPDCLRELFDTSDRRFSYPFLNCTNCGPRLTVITGTPYDRSRTTLRNFALCTACQTEYDTPTNRRFHAQPTACPACGPQLQLLDVSGVILATANPLTEFARSILTGKIAALKGLGGYHLVCDAQNTAAVAELRRRKHRDEKPFAVMLTDLAAVELECQLDATERELLSSPQSPIVLLRKRPDSCMAANVAPGNQWLGVMLPYTPLHHLLMRAVNNTPLVMTSGNRSDEPIAHRDDAPETLRGIADLFLTHNRPIHVRCDDSVTRVVDGMELPIRRSRGYAPRPIPLPFECPRPILALGGQLKATFALVHGRQAFLSHHLGDLEHLEAYKAFEQDVPLYEQLFAVRPEMLVHDLHPDYSSTRYAVERGNKSGIPLFGVQHHHAHLASCMAENALTEPVIGVTFDGTGYGTDGTVWGGEFLVGDYRNFLRAAHLRCVGMPGGERAIREPWRMAVAHLADAGVEVFPSRWNQSEVTAVRAMLARKLNSPSTSSAGRLIDAIAAIAGVRDRVSYEGQAAMELESLAADCPPEGSYPFDLTAEGEIDTRPLIRAVAQEALSSVPPARIARRFHSTLVEIIAATCVRVRAETGLATIVLSGGVFLNALLTSETCSRLRADGFRVYRHRLVPPNDGGLSLGQVAIAAHALASHCT